MLKAAVCLAAIPAGLALAAYGVSFMEVYYHSPSMSKRVAAISLGGTGFFLGAAIAAVAGVGLLVMVLS